MLGTGSGAEVEAGMSLGLRVIGIEKERSQWEASQNVVEIYASALEEDESAMPSQWDEEHRHWHDAKTIFVNGLAGLHSWVLSAKQDNCSFGQVLPEDSSLYEPGQQACNRCAGVRDLVKCAKCWRRVHTHNAAPGYLTCFYDCAACGPAKSRAKIFCSEICHNIAVHSSRPQALLPSSSIQSPEAEPAAAQPESEAPAPAQQSAPPSESSSSSR